MSNYRPISLTCVLSEILERMVVGRIVDHLHYKNILHSAQHGFLKSKSTCNLLDSFNDWSIIVQSRQQVAIVYIEFSKASDVVSHPKLFARLYSYGIRDSVLLWLKNFFTGRTHQTKIGSSFSDICDLISGVVQGSGIGPIMFLIFINELVFVLERFNIEVKLFADDAKMYVRILDDIDVVQLQTALDALSHWTDNWQLSISINKCCILNVGKVSHNVDVCLAGISLPAYT